MIVAQLRLQAKDTGVARNDTGVCSTHSVIQLVHQILVSPLASGHCEVWLLNCFMCTLSMYCSMTHCALLSGAFNDWLIDWSQCRTVVPHCCKGDAASQWEMAILGVSELRNPRTDRQKFDTRDYVGELPSYAKFHKIRRLKGWPAIWWNIPLAYFFKYCFEGDSFRASTEENTQQCQALNGLKCSTVGNLGS